MAQAVKHVQKQCDHWGMQFNIEHLSNWKKGRGCIRNLSNIYRTGKKDPAVYEIYRASIELEKRRGCIRNLSNIYRTGKKDPAVYEIYP